MNTDAARDIAFPNAGIARDEGGAAAYAADAGGDVAAADEEDDEYNEYNEENDDAGLAGLAGVAGEVDADGAPLIPRVSSRFSTGQVCFKGPATRDDIRKEIAEATQGAKDRAAATAAAAVAREERTRKELGEAFITAKALEARLSDPADSMSFEKLTIPQLKAILIFHNIPHKKSDPGTGKAYYVELARPLFE